MFFIFVTTIINCSWRCTLINIKHDDFWGHCTHLISQTECVDAINMSLECVLSVRFTIAWELFYFKVRGNQDKNRVIYLCTFRLYLSRQLFDLVRLFSHRHLEIRLQQLRTSVLTFIKFYKK